MSLARVDSRGMWPQQDCYEERFQLTGSGAVGLAAGLLSIGLGLLWHTPVIFTVAAAIFAALAFQGADLAGAVRRLVAFRADHAGITLGTVPGTLTPCRGPAVFVPWADVEQIVLYPAYPRGMGRYAQVQRIGIQRREGAPPLPRGNERAPDCPVPGVAAGATRKITGWRLDRERLTAVTAAVAPGIPILDAGTGARPGVEGPGRPSGPSRRSP